MATYPRLRIDLAKIKHNTQVISKLASKHQIGIVGVTKCCCGNTKIAEAMLAGGAIALADSRVENLRKLAESEIKTQLHLLRPPMPSELEEVVEYANLSINTELSTIETLSREAGKVGKVHEILLMVELGDIREGINEKELEPFIKKVLSLENIVLKDLAINLACFGGVVPNQQKLDEFQSIIFRLEKVFSCKFSILSGGNSANIPGLLTELNYSRINQLRIGEGILLGVETVCRTPIPGTHQDIFVLEAQVIEARDKPSVPNGNVSQNAFGEIPVFEDNGVIRRLILALGRQDIKVDGLTLIDKELRLLGSSSDHILLHDVQSQYSIGDIIHFKLDYGALLQAFTSPFVEKTYD